MELIDRRSIGISLGHFLSAEGSWSFATSRKIGSDGCMVLSFPFMGFGGGRDAGIGKAMLFFDFFFGGPEVSIWAY